MTQRKLQTLLRGGSFFEGPRWREGRWWVSDILGKHVITVDPRGKTKVILKVPAMPSGLGWLPDGSLLVASAQDHLLLRRWPNGKLTTHADLSALCGGNLNDIVVDALGRAWCGNFGFDASGGAEMRPANLIRVDPDGKVMLAAEGLSFPNGSIITPDNRTLIVGETRGARYTAFTIDPDGTLSNRRIWANLANVAPDGCALDSEGRIWCADAEGGRVLRVAEGGAILEEIKMPDGLRVFACMLGGEAGRTLLLCCVPPVGTKPRWGKLKASLLTTEVEVPHAGYP